MNALLAFARVVDALNEYIGRGVRWLVLVTVFIAALDALATWLVREFSHWPAFQPLATFYANSIGNAPLEAQWYLFGAVFLLAAGYTLKHNGHVRVDVLFGRLPARVRAWIDISGGLLFLLPMCVLMIWLSWPDFVSSWLSGERSSDAGGLIRWPVRLLIPLGFALLALQGVAETVKRAAFLAGRGPLPGEKPVEEV
jgi:TRAP-type mannitol/chloroaromatic compound transport system permease small subunit